MTTENNDLTLVTSGNGKTGRRLADRLIAAGRPVRIGSRAASPAFDWEDRSTWAGALDGVSAVYVAFQPDLAVPGALETVTAFHVQAVAAGARKLVLLSGRGEAEAEEAEKALRATDADWTILRASWFSQNFSEAHFLEPLQEGELALPVGPVPEPFIDVEDIADVAFAALTRPGHSHRLYELTGPRALTFAQAVAEIAAATGREIAFAAPPADDYRVALLEAQVPADVSSLVLHLLTTVLDGRNARVAHGVREALGREPRDFSEYVRQTAATGVWGGTHA
ncbi:MAG: NAD(P)H-binding protein [Phenylobacterium sp.]|uniref:NAD(P)H-binding protein n=1 Tax=Phenylobacterium sp. TaxID=1871053 RepID=UPI0027365E63|nr:NAD(P)H-binding protein [Phenylobacterium sp.]MDP3745554.1 NAD(P)H-binding protein [Phenylobacterium sp.]